MNHNNLRGGKRIYQFKILHTSICITQEMLDTMSSFCVHLKDAHACHFLNTLIATCLYQLMNNYYNDIQLILAYNYCIYN